MNSTIRRTLLVHATLKDVRNAETLQRFVAENDARAARVIRLELAGGQVVMVGWSCRRLRPAVD